MNEILIYGDIGWENTARIVMEQLKDFNGEPVQIRINSGGGDVYEGIAILNALRSYEGEITTVVESLAASAASFIAVGAGGRVEIRPNAELMIHRAWTFADGNSEDMARTISDLDRQDVKIAGIYAERAGGESDDWLALMSSETWYSAQEALDAGLVDEIVDAKKSTPDAALAARSNPKVFAQFRYNSRSTAPPPAHVSRSESAAETTKKGDTVGIFDELAEKFGKSPGDVEKAFTRFFNETVTVSGEVEVTYPADTPIYPTERVTIDAIVGDPANVDSGDGEAAPVEDGTAQNSVDTAGLGLAFEIGTVPEGYEASVDATSGTLKVKAPSGAEVGESVEIVVKVNGADVPATLKVRSFSEDEENAGGDPVDSAAPANASLVNAMKVDKSMFDVLVANNRELAQIKAVQARAERHERVDKWIEEGRISASTRESAIKVIDTDEKLAEEIYGAMPVNTVPRYELGNVGSGEPSTRAQELIAKSKQLRATRKNRKEN